MYFKQNLGLVYAGTVFQFKIYTEKHYIKPKFLIKKTSNI